MEILKQYQLGDMALTYVTDGHGTVGMVLTPWEMRGAVAEKQGNADSLVQVYVRGDTLPAGYGNGHTMTYSGTTAALRLAGQEQTGDTIVTTLTDARGMVFRHRAAWHEGLSALRVTTEAENGSDGPVTLELLASASLGGITPFAADDRCEGLILHRARSAWSAEGRMTDEPVAGLNMERSWTGHAIRTMRFGQTGSMPVRSWFPFASVEDAAHGVTWALQLACPSSWQIELRRREGGLALTAGLADADFGHWSKTLAPGERFTTPEALVTVGEGTAETVAQRLLTIHRENWVGRSAPLPVVFNEYCTTWGCPSHDNMVSLAQALRGHDVDYVVMDAGWYGREGAGWSDCGGDWVPNAALFPDGIRATADAIRAAGFKPGIWFEPETTARLAEVNQREEWLLKRRGCIIDTDNRRFLDLRLPEVQRYLDERVIGLLKEGGFEYVKIDYNDCIGMGCDSADGLGEGLRQNMQGTVEFFRRMQEQIPGLMVENCASGGHRLEPAMLGTSWLASVSEAHECAEIPILAANLHRLMLPGQSLIWAVLRAEDSLQRLNYSLAATLLGVMCLSGDVGALDEAQWARVDEGIRFYRVAQHIIRDGVSEILGEVSSSWRHPEGWQAVVRRLGTEQLAVIHTFGGELPQQVTLPVPGAEEVLDVMCSGGNEVTLDNGCLTVTLKTGFEAIAIRVGQKVRSK